MTEEMTITLTKCAADQYRRVLAEEGKVGWGLRLDGQASGCRGFEYELDYSEKAREEDQVFVTEGVEVHIRKSIVPHLLGSHIDFVDGPEGAGFRISNPYKKSSCGGCCGCH